MRRLAPLLAVALLPGCGTADDRTQARAAVERFYAAVRHHDGTRACAQLSADAVKALEQQESRPCSRAVVSLDLHGGRVVADQVYITNAKVDLTGAESAFLGREPEGWKLSAVGCRFDRGKPADRPADCEVEG